VDVLQAHTLHLLVQRALCCLGEGMQQADATPSTPASQQHHAVRTQHTCTRACACATTAAHTGSRRSPLSSSSVSTLHGSGRPVRPSSAASATSCLKRARVSATSCARCMRPSSRSFMSEMVACRLAQQQRRQQRQWQRCCRGQQGLAGCELRLLRARGKRTSFCAATRSCSLRRSCHVLSADLQTAAARLDVWRL
jgi:hypothetical protein